MKTLVDLKTFATVLAFLACLGLAAQTAKATGGDGDGDNSAPRSAESNAPPVGFIGLQMALSSFHRNAIVMGPEKATAKLLFDLQFAPLIQLITAIHYQHLFGSSNKPSKAANAPETPSFFSLGNGLSPVKRLYLSGKLSGVLGRKDALVTEEEGGRPFWILELRCDGDKGAKATWKSGKNASDPAKGRASGTNKKAAKAGCKEPEITKFEKSAFDLLGSEYEKLLKKYGTDEARSKTRQRKVRDDAFKRFHKAPGSSDK